MTRSTTQAQRRHWRRTAALGAVVLLASTTSAHAYIGPGAGIAFAGSFLVIFLAILSAIGTVLTWPIRWLLRSIRGRRALRQAKVKRVVILGLDGMEPTLVDQYVAAGRMPNFKRLMAKGCFKRLGTTLPPLSPVAWSSFLTGCNPGKHNIFDFLSIDRRNYLPLLSSVHIGGPRREFRLGSYRIPWGKPSLRLLRKGVPFWNLLGEHGVFSDVIRVPITWPPEKFRGVLLSAMCVPDLRGSQGTFSYYTTRSSENVPYTGGEQVRVKLDNGIIRTELIGPDNSLRADRKPLTVPFSIQPIDADSARLRIQGQQFMLRRGEYTPWVRFHFSAGPASRVHGIAQFLLLAVKPELELYVTPLQIDPAKPVMPISHPPVYSTYLAKAQGSYATLGLAEDTWALNEQILQDPGFLHQCTEADEERETMFFDALDKTRRGLVCCVFDGTDRVQHMFWRYLDKDHPAHEGFGESRLREAIPELYERMDALVGKTMAACDDPDTLLMVISDHGFKSFRYGIDLNRWLIDEGYMALKSPANGERYLATVDWSKTRAYAMGLAGIFLNIAGRETQGTVTEGEEADTLRAELAGKLTGLTDPRSNNVAINRAYVSKASYRGPYTGEAPDLIIGYNENYRVAWETAVGDVTDTVFHDNTKAWSGDHCLDPRLVPGILLCNRDIESNAPRLLDIGPTVLEMFGVSVPAHMDGKPLTIAGLNGLARAS